MEDIKNIIGFDTETHLISQQNQAPRIVCASLAMPLATTPPTMETDLIGNNDWQRLESVLQNLLTDDSLLKVGQSVAYDLCVLAANFPSFIPIIFQALENERVSCTIIREKLLVLATTGDLEFLEMPDGSKIKAKWDMATLVKKYFGVDLSADKTDNDAWRTNYAAFDGVPVEQWPEGARKYATDDAVWVVAIWKMQEEQREKVKAERGIDPFATESFRVMLDFCLKLMSAWGMATDPAMVAVVEAEMAAELTPEKLNLLISNGILRPGTPPKAHKNAKEHVAGCPGKDCTCPPRYTKGTKDSIDTKKLKDYIIAWADRMNACKDCEGTGVERVQYGGTCPTCKGTKLLPDEKLVVKLKYTEKSDKFPEGQLSCDAEFLEDYAHLDPVLTQYKHRQDLQKIVTTELPRMRLRGQTAAVVHPQYDCLKSTGRSSCFSSKSPEYASFNGQNVDPKVRRCFVPRDGYLLWSTDYNQMELGTVAQKCFELFGRSVLREKINAGVDVHAYTGAQLAFALEPKFTSRCHVAGCQTRDDIGNVFFLMANSSDPADQKFYKHWRKFAKPVNLGYPGGLGPKTFVKLAKVAYDVVVDLDTATLFRDLWKETYPEFYDYFDYVNKQCVDPFNKGWDDEEKKEYNLYCYTSPFGMHRAGCDYCAVANGMGLQTPSAEGQKTAVIRVVRACYDWTQQSILGPDQYGLTVRPILDIHDEIVGEVRDDQLAHDRMMEVKRIFLESMRMITPDVAVNATPVLMRRWDKDAKPVYDANGRLTVWTPEGK